MPTQLESFNKDITDISNNWTITKTVLNTKFDEAITDKLNNNTHKNDTTQYIKIDDYRSRYFLNINADGTYGAGNLLDLSNIVHTDLINLETEIDDHLNTYNFNADRAIVENSLATNKQNYLDNKKSYIENKDKIHGALIRAKSQNENYNYLVSSTINLICGILILFYLIYKIYSPITVEELKTAVKTTTETATKVAKQAQTATNKIVSK